MLLPQQGEKPPRHQKRLTCIPSSSLLMHQKLSASMLRKTSCDRFVTSKFSTSSSAKQRGKSIRRTGETRRLTGHIQGLYQAKAGQEAPQGSLHDLSGLPGTEHSTHALTYFSNPGEGLKDRKRLSGHDLNPAQLPGGPRERSHSAAAVVIPLGRGLCTDKAPGIWDPSCWSASRPGLQQVSVSWWHHRENGER